MDIEGFDRITIREREFRFAQGFDRFRSSLLSDFPREKRALEAYISQLSVISRSFPLYNLESQPGSSKEPFISSGAYDFFSSLTPDNLLPSVLAGNNFLYAGDWEKTPLHVAALINHSFISSAWRLIGGSRQIADFLIREIRSLGGEIFTSHEAWNVSRDKEVFRIITRDGARFEAKTLISNLHPGATLHLMDPSMIRDSYRIRINSLENTVSSFILNLVLKKGSFPYLNHNVYYYDSDNVWTSGSSRGKRWPENYLLYTPARTPEDESADSAIILTYMDYSEVKQWEGSARGTRDSLYEEFKQERSERLLKLVSNKFPTLPASVISREASTPLTYQDYTGTPEGSMYGVKKDFSDPLRTMLVPRTKIRNLFFTGQNFGLHGMLGVTIGAIQTCGEILGLDYLMNKIRKH
jgi:all-trans-retinol 13,14-reductase